MTNDITFHLGFTGTQDGMTKPQMRSFKKEIKRIANVYDQVTFHHGDCIGSDEEAHFIAVDNLFDIEIHPPVYRNKRAFCMEGTKKGVVKIREHHPKDYLVRNVNIVDQTVMLLATPKGLEQRRSGTWSTVRYARKLKRPIRIIYPDGSVREEG